VVPVTVLPAELGLPEEPRAARRQEDLVKDAAEVVADLGRASPLVKPALGPKSSIRSPPSVREVTP
jgi:hypothetical protein